MDWKQRALYQLMSDISEACYCAGWMSGNEYTLWEMVSNPSASRNYGMDEVDATDLADLREMAAESGGWIRWRDDEEDQTLPSTEWGPVFTPMADWLPMYERRMVQWTKLREEIAERNKTPGAAPTLRSQLPLKRAPLGALCDPVQVVRPWPARRSPPVPRPSPQRLPRR
jgi:hypothetical protein